MPPFIAWIGSLHMLILNFYYRGVVYVIVGPRKKIPPPKPDENDDDDDWDEIDKELEELEKSKSA